MELLQSQHAIHCAYCANGPEAHSRAVKINTGLLEQDWSGSKRRFRLVTRRLCSKLHVDEMGGETMGVRGPVQGCARFRPVPVGREWGQGEYRKN